MFGFNIKLKGLKQGQKLFEEKMHRVLIKALFKMEELAIKNAPVDQGFLRQNISLFPQILANKYILVSGAPYSAAMEYGTRPYYAPVAPLSAWSRRKFGKDVGYAVQEKIAKYGITAQPFMRPALWEVQTFWVDFYKKEEL